MLRKFFYSALLLILILVFSPPLTEATDNFIKYPLNPILIPTSQAWDSERVWQPSVIFDGTEYKMYYSAFNGSKFQIGLAHSNDGITWTKDLNNPVITRITIDNKDSHDPNVIYDGSSYYMWYVSSDNGGSSNFAIQRAYSANGINWINDPIIPVLKITSGWGSLQGVSSPSVLKIDTNYKIWYSSQDSGQWSTGLATSLDGITWEPYTLNPVITPTESWEDGQSANPDVIFDGTKYKMYYGGISHIAYADSNDGISWSKPLDNNPILQSSQLFDSNRLGNASSIYLSNNTHALYYDGLGGVDGTTTWRIGVAFDGPLPPTPTPTPTPVASKKVVVIPGFGASWNADAFFNCKIDAIQDPWVLNPAENSIYPSLYNSLSNAGYTPIPFYYDWRKSLGTLSDNLAAFIKANTAPNETVDLVGHSFGGLVGRAYLTYHPDNNRINKYISIGSPHNGTAIAYPAWANGDIMSDDQNFRRFMIIARQLCMTRYRVDQQEAIHRFIPSIQDLLPIFPYLRNGKNGQLTPLGLMQTINSWLPSHPFPSNTNITIGTLAGTGQKTVSGFQVKSPSKHDLLGGNWVDGKIVKNEYSIDGDGTVLTQSAQLSGADNRVIPGSHTGIISSNPGQQEIISFLSGTPNIQRFTIVSAPIDVNKSVPSLVILSYPAHTTLTDPAGKVVKDTEGIIVIDNPRKGKFNLSVSPKKVGQIRFVIIQFYNNGTYSWKEYNHWFPTRKNLQFFIDPDDTSEHFERE